MPALSRLTGKFHYDLQKIPGVLNSALTQAQSCRRVLAAVVLLFLFFLPLHFHGHDAAAYTDDECVCIHGTRLQLAVGVTGWIWTPSFRKVSVPGRNDSPWAADWTTLQHVRGPPLPPSR